LLMRKSKTYPRTCVLCCAVLGWAGLCWAAPRAAGWAAPRSARCTRANRQPSLHGRSAVCAGGGADLKDNRLSQSLG
jgi:hypothetical protein